MGLEPIKVAAQNANAPALASDDDAALSEGKVAEWCTDGLQVLYRPAFPNALPAPGPAR